MLLHSQFRGNLDKKRLEAQNKNNKLKFLMIPSSGGQFSLNITKFAKS